ncbi:MAG: Wzz/FepE/Etk N-terminal domain-containing protein [Thermodesulfobacteriota bacterium]
MDQGRQIDPDAHRYEYYEDEIELMDLLKVIWKWKYLILAGTLICAVGAALISLQMTRVYRVDMSVSPGILRINEDGKNLYIDSIENIRTLIEAGTFDRKILQDLDVPQEEARPESIALKVETPKELNAVRVSYETPYPQLGIEVLSDLYDLLRERYLTVVRYHKKTFDLKQEEKTNELENLDNEISNNRARIVTAREKIKNFEDRQRHVEKEISRISKNTDALISERNNFLSSEESEKNTLSALLYSNTIQQNISYLDTLRTTANYVKSNMYELQLEIETLQNTIKDLESKKRYVLEEINDLEMKKESVQNIQLLQHPQKSPGPIKPKVKLNTVLAAVVGLFITVFLAFFVEYISKYKRREAEEETPG